MLSSLKERISSSILSRSACISFMSDCTSFRLACISFCPASSFSNFSRIISNLSIAYPSRFLCYHNDICNTIPGKFIKYSSFGSH
ncbi:hypothetical protein DSY1127 [Desulfitobacterium hafniense Y51]|uniref:Uncharacterized protein n=1 Tax=Desulfitobacterium hafniense (strain Y51) TaxID=138119 RepID=Q24YH6_DESHY|nr:hypothetical protein DSY1127 [Desulfitobacterium hafniense Y51]